MNNQSTVAGNENIVIQGVSDSTITLNVNGETKEVRNDLAELRSMMEQLSIQTFQIKQQVYNFEELDESTLKFINTRKSFTDHLTRHLLEALRPYSDLANKFYDRAQKESEDWTSVKDIRDTAHVIIARSFVGVLGLQLRRVLAIGKDKDISSEKQANYIRYCYLTAQHTLQLISFGLLSKLWDTQLEKFVAPSEQQAAAIAEFFDGMFERNLSDRLILIRHLLDFFSANSILPHLSELADFHQHLTDGCVFMQACLNLQKHYDEMERMNYSLFDCYECEKDLTTMLTTLSFMAEYKMISVKNITYNEIRNQQPQYLHKFAALGVDLKSNENTERLRLDDEPIITDGILLYKEKYNKSTNLFPFIIDYNSLTEESGSKICFYDSRHISDGSLNYVVLANNTKQNIAFRNTLSEGRKLVDIMMNDRDRVALKLDTVYNQMMAARNAILGSEATSDFKSILEEEEDDF